LENFGNKGEEDLKKNFFFAFIVGTALSLLLFIFSFFLPSLLTSNYYERSLNRLRHTASEIKNEFSRVLDAMDANQSSVREFLPLDTNEEIFSMFKRLNLNPETEGISYCDRRGNIVIWLGNIIDLQNVKRHNGKGVLFEEKNSSLLIKTKASVYLISIKKTPNGNCFVYYHLLAFLPQFETPYLREYHFLQPKLLRNCTIQYWDFRDDVSTLERIFLRHEDEYVGEPGLQGEVQTLIFPLRDLDKKIMATVNLNSPSLSSRLSSLHEQILLISYLLFGISMIFLLFHLVRSTSFYRERKLLSVVFIILTLAGLRMLFFPLSNLEKIQSLSIFSPSIASFLSVWNFTQSPADIFLTAFIFFLIVGCGLICFRGYLKKKKAKNTIGAAFFVNIIVISFTLLILFLFQEILTRLVSHSNLNLLRISFEPSFFLLHLSIFLFLFTFLLLCFTMFQLTRLFSRNMLSSLVIFAIAFAFFVFIFRNRIHPLFFFVYFILLLALLIFAQSPDLLRKREVLFSAFILAIFLVYSSIDLSFSQRNKILIENFLQNIIKSQETWGNYLIRESLPEIDKRAETIKSFLQNPEPSDLAQTLWEETWFAKFSWYSSLEILTPEGVILSRFSLNVPELFQLEFALHQSKDWIISHQNLLFRGLEKDFLVGYKDWFVEEEPIGRLMIFLSVDYDVLPFLYSANPYFELVRVSSIPSLNQLDLGFAIFDLNGELIFNPNKMSKGIPPATLQRVSSSSEAFWSSFVDKEKKFNSLYFKYNQKIYALFLPEKNFLDHSVDFLKLFFLYLLFFMIFLFALILSPNRKKIKNPFWSFSNRVYISFVAIALIPLILFTVSTRNFFRQMFTQQITEKAEIHANFARRIVEDFISEQQDQQLSLTLPPDYVMLLISSAISNDVNLYQDGRLISSSRREFFDYGILPEMIDGEVYYKIQYENNPFYSQSQNIGDYSFHTLTVPYLFEDSLLLISLPFPLEQQEISKATRELVEFFFLISSFFVFIVLLFARGMGGMIVTPIRKLLAGTREVSVGNLEVSIPHQHQDEMKTLIDGFNSMVENLKKHQQDLAEMSKKVAWAEMARKVAHEIKNPLTPIQLSAEHLLSVYKDKKGDFDETLLESTSYIIKEVENLRKIAKEFLEISKETALQKEAFDIKEIVRETIAPYKKILAERIILKETYEGEDFIYIGDKTKINIALRNVFTNAVEAIEGRGKIEVKVCSEKGALTIEINDTGVGIDQRTLDRIFEPYYSTKEVGTGLGLTIAKKIIEDHEGKITASSQKNVGTKITISLPRKG
jgi:signal transduction histidine kinase